MAAPSVPPSPLGLVRAAQAVAAEGRLRLFSALGADRREALVRAGGVAAARVRDADRREALVRAAGVAARLALDEPEAFIGTRRVGRGSRGGLGVWMGDRTRHVGGASRGSRAALITRVDAQDQGDRDA